jgi:hypothetical protein
MYISKGFISQRSTVHYVGVISSDSTISTRICILKGIAASPCGFSLFHSKEEYPSVNVGISLCKNTDNIKR